MNFLASKLLSKTSIPVKNHGSDHQAILIDLSLHGPPKALRKSMPKWGDISPDSVCQKIKPEIDALCNSSDQTLEGHFKHLTDAISKIQDSMGKKVEVNPGRSKSWWCTATLNPIIETRNRARQWMMLTGSPEAADCYKQWCVYFREMVGALKRNAWWRFLENSSDNTVFKVFRTIKKPKTAGILPLRRSDGTITSDKKEQAELLFNGTSVINAPIDLSDVPLREITGRNDHPDRKLKANINKISSTLRQQINPEKKNSLQARISDLPIDVTALINQLASHHSPLHHHLFKAKRRLDPLCPHCSGRKTSSHLMNFCHKYKAARRQLRSNAQWE